MKITYLLALLYSIISFSQEYFPTNTGVSTSNDTFIAFKNAKIYVSPNNIINKGTLLIKNNKIINVGKNITVPKGSEVIDLNNKTVYPSFIDIYSEFGFSKPTKKHNRHKIQYHASRKGYYWNDHIRPDIKSIDTFKFNAKKAKELLKLGFGTVNTHLEDGIMQGTGVLVALSPQKTNAYRILNDESCSYLSFNKSKKSDQIYPTSLMGAIALIKQTYLDAKWYGKGKSKTKDLALEALNKKRDLTQIFNAGSYLNILRTKKLSKSVDVTYTILGGGNEYERIKEIKETNSRLIIPINFRKAYDVKNSIHNRLISLNDMRSWNLDPTNPAMLAKNEIEFAITAKGTKKTTFLKNLIKAVHHGLDKTIALKSLTTVPAKIAKNKAIGNLNKGSYANFLITSGDIFEPNTVLYENWVLGEKNVIIPIKSNNIIGDYTIKLNNKTYNLNIKWKNQKQIATVKLNNKKIPATFSLKNSEFELKITDKGSIYLTSTITDNKLTGSALFKDGSKKNWTAIKNKNTVKEEKIKKPELVEVSYPNIAYGNKVLPKAEDILIKNATLWTSETKNPILKNTDILIVNGKIKKIGKNITAKNAKQIEGKGKIVTAGIIDEHSHIATSAVNEVGHNCTAEVSIEDVINPDDINIYRNLAGGVTSIQVLHGSANPIGGRSAIIKLKWGESAKNLIYKNSPKFIKFALGENVKQSNWGSHQNIRFPQTRMGVEQVYIDYFNRALAYEKSKKKSNYRKDLELETLLEIIKGERFITCHSYVQSEINMLMKVAEKFNFKINTFTHILEGYKVADKMKKHGAGGSTFADWWAYKYEVNDAIPFNAAIMHKQGITVAINSDDAEMSRRLNQEAAKLIKYGGMSEQESWKTITINPAKLLHLDKRTGSLKEGKDADIVIWDNNPLSVYSKVLTTIVDGAIYFSNEEDKIKRTKIKEERKKLINMMLKHNINGNKTQSPSKKKQKLFHCDTE